MSAFSSSPTSAPSGDGNTIDVMLVDDSAVIRGGLARTIKSDPLINVVASIQNGELAIEAAKRHQPHVIILDIEMPVMDGLTALPKILEVSPKSKVIMFSSLTEKGASVSLKAFSLGAVECLVKPSSSQNVGDGSDFQRDLLGLIQGFFPNRRPAAAPAGATPHAASSMPAAADDKKFTLNSNAMAYKGRPSLLAIGSSTGGPQALFNVIKSFKDFDIPIILTQHMPATFTKILADHITQQTGVMAFEGEDSMVVEAGNVYVAPGGFHMLLVKDGTQLKLKIDDGPQENYCKPAVDPMFRSALDIFGNKVLGVILTGMGSDGLKGSQMLVEQGGRLVAQDEESSVVWGMPGAVAMAGVCSEVLPLDDIGPWIRKAVLG
jgi:two-component system chemotaxis response regulator CheB